MSQVKTQLLHFGILTTLVLELQYLQPKFRVNAKTLVCGINTKTVVPEAAGAWAWISYHKTNFLSAVYIILFNRHNLNIVRRLS